MYLNNKKIFLAGGTGMVGSAIIKYILANYPNTRIKATYKNTEPFIKNERVEYIYCDLTVKEDCRNVATTCDCAIMAAAFTGGSNLTSTFPLKHIQENLAMNVNMLNMFCKEGIKRIVCIGSATLYQEFDGYIKENELDLNKDPHAAYLGFGWTVRYIEKLCEFLHNTHNIEIIMVRASNIFGYYAGFSPEISNFIPAIIRKAVDKMEPFEVWGSPDITRDVIFSEDFAKAIVMMLDDDKIKFDAFNIGSGVKITVADVVKWALKYACYKPKETKYISGKPETFKFRALDISKAKSLLGWQPEYSIQEGIKKTTEWWIENKREWKK